MPSLHQVVPTVDALLVCTVGCITVWHSPYLEFDAGVILVGAASSSLLFWQGRWSWSYLMRCAVAAYCFRCVVLYVVGTDAVKGIAVGSLGMGLSAAGGGYIVRQIVHRYTSQGRNAVSQHLSRKEYESSDSYSDEKEIEEENDTATRVKERKETVWSPPQFRLKTVFMLVFAWAGLLAVGVTAGLHLACGVFFLAMLWVLIGGCVRLVLVGRQIR